jgi:hypothetical protein
LLHYSSSFAHRQRYLTFYTFLKVPDLHHLCFIRVYGFWRRIIRNSLKIWFCIMYVSPLSIISCQARKASRRQSVIHCGFFLEEIARTISSFNQ